MPLGCDSKTTLFRPSQTVQKLDNLTNIWTVTKSTLPQKAKIPLKIDGSHLA